MADKKKLNANAAAEAAKLAVNVIRAKAGDPTGLALQALKYIKYIILGAGCFLIIIVLLISMPLVALGRLLFPDTTTAEGAFFESEYNNAITFSGSFIKKEEKRFEESEKTAKSAVTLGEHDTWDAVCDIELELSPDELLILNSVLFDEYDGEPIDFSKLDILGDSVITRISETAVTYSMLLDEDGNEYTVTHYLFIYTARLIQFSDMLVALGLDELQTARAMVMYNFLYDQDQSNSYGNDFNGYSLGSVTYSDGLVDVVYYNQYDTRWKDISYGRTGTLGRSGCGPTSLAMAISSLGGGAVSPVEVAEWAADNGYYVEGAGSKHALIPDGARHWGVPVKAAGYDWQAVVDALADGKLVIAIMGKGHFTSSGHFIVLRGVTGDGKIRVADSASVTRSEQLWDASIIVSETRKGASAGGAFWILG